MSPPVTLLDVLVTIAPGTMLRDALERIVQHGTGALVVLGTGPEVENITSGGFKLDDAEFTPAKLAELAKMDGGIILDDACEYILWANAHLLPSPSVVTVETGARFRTAERVAKETGKPIVAVSEERSVVTVFFGDDDCRVYVEMLSAAVRDAERGGWARCLLPNHAHMTG